MRDSRVRRKIKNPQRLIRERSKIGEAYLVTKVGCVMSANSV